MESIVQNIDLTRMESSDIEEALSVNGQLSRKEKRGLRVILGHAGKKKVFGSYVQTNPEIARKYLDFVADHSWVRYCHWDAINKKFMTAS